MTARGTAIEFEHVSKDFVNRRTRKRVRALADGHFAIAPGEFVSVIGASGCGKSTLLNMLAGLMPPTGGRVLYQGQPVQRVNTKIGYVTQKDSLLPWRTVEQNVGLALEIKGVSAAERRERVQEMIDRVGLTGFNEHYPAQLSGGMRKRVTLARTLIYRPETLVMDEPFGALDAQLKIVMHKQLLSLWEQQQMTVLFVTHDLGEAIALSDRVVVVSSRPGRVREIVDIELPRPRDPSAVRFDQRFGDLYQRLWDDLRDDIEEAP